MSSSVVHVGMLGCGTVGGAVARMLTDTCDAFAPARYSLTPPPMPLPARTASRMAPFRRRPVSSAMPNRPGPRAASTSSDVAPDSASSKS